MSGGREGAASRLRRRLARLSGPALAGLVAAGVVTVAGAATLGYRTYDWVEHDNEFCLSCHLMAEPYELFAASAHADLGCKDCHTPTFTARSQMALTQVLQDPDSLTVHAEVPNEKCASCHVDGDPDRWENIANTAGHRVHFESDDPALDDLACVRCHSTSVHEFAATDRTCAQSGCHTDVEVRLGRMSDLTIHCAACHSFGRDVAEPAATGGVADPLPTALRPERSECLSCHQMQLRVDMPDDEPHDQSCGACHNPHDQTTPQQAVESCATGACHADPVDLTPHHVGLPDGVVEDCSTCHTAHVFRVDGGQCAACHQDVAPLPSGAAAAFDHGRHAEVDCASCHQTAASHGQVVLDEPADCLACHHTEPVGADCASCHDAADTPEATLPVRRPYTPSAGDAGVRTLAFDHDVHVDVACATCHSDGLELSAAAVDCASCHEEHHEPDARCASCHLEPPTDAHTVQAHVNCVTCHVEAPATVAAVPRTRDFCVSCHRDMEDHRPEGNCAECHQLPPPSGGAP